MYRLTANKTKLYALAKHFWPEIGPMHETEFIKYHRRRDYAIKFKIGGYYHKLFLASCLGDVLLRDEWYMYDDDGNAVTGREVRRIPWDMLQRLELLEEIPDLKEG